MRKKQLQSAVRRRNQLKEKSNFTMWHIAELCTVSFLWRTKEFFFTFATSPYLPLDWSVRVRSMLPSRILETLKTLPELVSSQLTFNKKDTVKTKKYIYTLAPS